MSIQGRDAGNRRRSTAAAHTCADPCCRADGRRPVCLQAAQHRGLSRSGPADDRDRDAESRPVVGGDRALHHHSDRSADGGHSLRHVDPHHLADRPLRREGAVQLRPQLPRSLTARDQPPVAARTAAQRRAAFHRADQPDRRDLPLPRGRPARLQRHRPQDHPGLDPAAPPEIGAGRDRHHELGRQEQDLRHHRRPRQAAGLRPHPEAGARRAERRQHQCRRQHGQSRPAVGGDQERRPDPHHGRHRPHHADGARRLAGAGLRRGDHHGRQRAATGRGRPGQRRRHRAGHRADAARRGDPADPARRREGGRAHQPFRPAAARRAHRAHLRPQRAGRRHDPAPCCTTW